jgi:hypothetical protein
MYNPGRLSASITARNNNILAAKDVEPISILHVAISVHYVVKVVN